MKKTLLKTVLPITLLVAAVFVIGSGCTADPEEYIYNWWPDLDEDGFGDRFATPISANNSNAPADHVRDNSDCNDADANVHPDANEIPDNLIDENCNGLYAVTFYKDSDNDGFGDPNISDVYEIELGETAPNGFVSNNADCDDTNPNINPLADEIPENGIDDNCDGDTDIFEIYLDADGDGYGSNQFAAGPGVHNNIDCDDVDAEIYPYRQEVLDNGIDDNCNGLVDEIN